VGSLVAFDGTGSNDPDGSIATWEWSFGDGSTGSGATASHAYSATGSYTAELTVTDGAGGSASTTHAVPVAAPQATLAQVQPEPQSVTPGILVPQLSVRLLRQRLRAVLRHGLSYIVSSNVRGTARMTLVVSKRTARRLGLRRRVTLASSRRDVLAGTPLPATLRPGRTVRAHLAGVRRLTATLRVTLGQTTVVQPVTLR
jgi:hypothetical protein